MGRPGWAGGLGKSGMCGGRRVVRGRRHCTPVTEGTSPGDGRCGGAVRCGRRCGPKGRLKQRWVRGSRWPGSRAGEANSCPAVDAGGGWWCGRLPAVLRGGPHWARKAGAGVRARPRAFVGISEVRPYEGLGSPSGGLEWVPCCAWRGVSGGRCGALGTLCGAVLLGEVWVLNGWSIGELQRAVDYIKKIPKKPKQTIVENVWCV